MGVRAQVIFLAFCGLILHTTWGCQLSCSNDYISSLNCSCTGHEPPYSPYLVLVDCWDETDQVNASCEITAPRHWCIAELDYEFNIGHDTQCEVRGALLGDEQQTGLNNSVYLTLSSHIKPQPPFNVVLRENGSNFVISWEMVYTEDKNFYLNDELIYRVRIRAEDSSWEVPKYFTVNEDRRNKEISYSILEPGKKYMVDVQAKPSFTFFQGGYWSDFSQTLELQTKCHEAKQGNNWPFYFPILVLVFCVFLYIKRRKWHLKACICSYIPSPEDFFKPLYHMHGGDFTKWVGPTFIFGEFDFLEKNMEVVSGKQSNIPSKCEKANEDSGSRSGRGGKCLSGGLLANSHAWSSSKQNLLDGSNRSQDTLLSNGLISINTVTVMEEDSGNLRSSWVPYHGSLIYPSYGLGESPGHEEEALLSVEAGQGAVVSGGHTSGGGRIAVETSVQLKLACLQWSRTSRDNDPEQLSLDSYSSTERSEDGYPNVVLDLDTFDSGFLESECSSPIQSDFGAKEEMADAVISVAQHSRTNYVKQWVNATSASDMQADATG